VNFLSVLVLAIIQGFTEFLPVSSSAHLVFGKALLGVREEGVALEVVLHLGTLLAVLIYYRDDLLSLLRGAIDELGPRGLAGNRQSLQMIGYLVIGTIPAVVGAVFIKDYVEAGFNNPRGSSLELLINGVMLLSTLLAAKGRASLGAVRALVIGIAQFISILPGISRSGATIGAALFMKIKPEEAARFSFLLSIPAILGAAVFELGPMIEGLRSGNLGLYAFGFVISFFTGLLAIDVLLRVVQRGRFALFGVYCVVVGLFGLWFFRGN